MNVKLEKWYLDFTSEKETGFYYIMCITIGRFKFGFSGINHYDSSFSIQSFRLSRIRQCSFHKLLHSKAGLSMSINEAYLHIDHGKTGLQGTWMSLSPPVKRLRKPLFRNAQGYVDWKVWTPLADVNLLFRHEKKTTELKGSGYIDFVKLTLPFWQLPLQTLHWGRMHSRDSWSVFLSLQTEREKISLYFDPQTAVQDVSASIERNVLGEAQHMIWTIGAASDAFSFNGYVIRTLESQDVLSKGRALCILPRCLRRRLCSSGRDEKYEVVSQIGDQSFHGIMEEVRYHE
jgi:hypothetical protein